MRPAVEIGAPLVRALSRRRFRCNDLERSAGHQWLVVVYVPEDLTRLAARCWQRYKPAGAADVDAICPLIFVGSKEDQLVAGSVADQSIDEGDPIPGTATPGLS